jgi:tRNA (guanine-N7-)-methyltransferase
MTVECDPRTCRPPLQEAPEGGWDLELSLAELEKPLDLPAMFGRTGPVEVEIGCGSGLYLAQDAALRTGVNFLGIESDRAQVRRSKDKWRRRNLLNTRIVHCDALYFLEDYPPDHSIDAYIVLYSDPWPKKRHHKRRLFQPRFVSILERTLKPGGLLTVKTDVTPYYEVIAELLSEAPFLETLFDKRLDLEFDPGDISTNYQRKALEQGHPIHYMKYRKR